jgi:hypothetical protein
MASRAQVWTPTSSPQWWDIVGVLRVTPAIDHLYVRRWASSLGVADLLERALSEAGQ